MTDQQQLDALLATHADEIRAHLPDYLHHLTPFKTERFGPLTKYTLGQLPDGRWAMLHCLSQPDQGPPHCHPCDMQVYIIAGGYYERRFRLDSAGSAIPYRVTLRMPGESNYIAADCIHSIFELANGPSWSLATGSITPSYRKPRNL
jgi:hypothetical protein